VSPDRYAVGIDLGGSKLRGGLLSPEGHLVGRLEVQTEAWKGAPGVLANLKGVMGGCSTHRARARHRHRHAAAGQIHPKSCRRLRPNLEWENVPPRRDRVGLRLAGVRR
jgi:predicted NBD/HSP70 family sugar kinase